MVPKLHSKGTSFKGAAAYLLHDKEQAEADERVAWTETRNIASNDPDTAWRVMAATAIDQDRLKEEAGVKATGRRSNKSVLHFSLSWHPDEKEELTQEEMRRAAYGALRELGASKHQALIVCHDDEIQPHLHVLVNRVSPEDGRMLSSSKEKLKLSEWAQEYERERGTIYCEQRVLNNDARARGEFTRAAKEKSRNVYEAEKAANDNSAKAEAIKEELRRKTAELAERSRQVRDRHAAEWSRLEERHKQRGIDLEADTKRRAAMAQDEVRQGYRPQWELLFHEDQAEQAAFEQREEKLFGRVQNAFRAIDFGSIVRGDDRRRAISEAFGALSDAGVRLETLKREQEQRASLLLAQQQAAEREAAQRLEWQRQGELARNRELFVVERSELVFAHQMDEAAVRAHWHERTAERAESWEGLRREQEQRQQEQRRAAEQAARTRPEPERSAPGREPERDDPQAEFEAWQERFYGQTREGREQRGEESPAPPVDHSPDLSDQEKSRSFEEFAERLYGDGEGFSESGPGEGFDGFGDIGDIDGGEDGP